MDKLKCLVTMRKDGRITEQAVRVSRARVDAAWNKRKEGRLVMEKLEIQDHQSQNHAAVNQKYGNQGGEALNLLEATHMRTVRRINERQT